MRNKLKQLLPARLDDRICLYLIVFAVEYYGLRILAAIPKIREVAQW